MIITVTVIKQPHYEVKIRHNPEYQDKVREPHKAEHIKLVIRFRVPSKTKQWYQIRATVKINPLDWIIHIALFCSVGLLMPMGCGD